MTHERNLYRVTFNKQVVLICRQVDDFAVACTDFKTTQEVIMKINTFVTTDDMGMGIVTEDGLFS